MKKRKMGLVKSFGGVYLPLLYFVTVLMVYMVHPSKTVFFVGIGVSIIGFLFLPYVMAVLQPFASLYAFSVYFVKEGLPQIEKEFTMMGLLGQLAIPILIPLVIAVAFNVLIVKKMLET